jgi:hypothetical protein
MLSSLATLVLIGLSPVAYGATLSISTATGTEAGLCTTSYGPKPTCKVKTSTAIVTTTSTFTFTITGQPTTTTITPPISTVPTTVLSSTTITVSTTATASTVTIPAPIGYVPVNPGAGARLRLARGDGRRRVPAEAIGDDEPKVQGCRRDTGFYPAVYPQVVNCEHTVTAVTTTTVTATAVAVTVTASAPVVTIATTSIVTVTSTATVMPPTATFYAACANTNLLPNVAGITYTPGVPVSRLTTVQQASAYDCCVRCFTTDDCAVADFYAGSCNLIATANGQCVGGAAASGPSIADITLGGPAGSFVINGPCGRYNVRR